MTTVGYGDKSPKSQPARVLAIIWILLGITGCAIFVGTLTTEMMMARKLSPPDMRERKVGVLKERMHETLMVSQHEVKLQRSSNSSDDEDFSSSH